MTFKDNAIADVKVLSSGETQRILDTVIERLIPRIIEAQSLAWTPSPARRVPPAPSSPP